MVEKIIEMQKLIPLLITASTYYYKFDKPIMSDYDYDKLYDRLVELEEQTGVTYSNSPTQRVQGFILEGLSKVTHTKPMLSAAKTKDIDECKKFVNGQKFYVSYKLDGLTIVLRYNNGTLVQAITRGDGITGEDVTEQAKMISNIPINIPFKDYLELRGECLISWETFNEINKTLEVPYKHPRNLAAGTIRNFDTSIVKDRNLKFLCFEIVSGCNAPLKTIRLDFVETLGFETVGRIDSFTDIDSILELMNPENSDYPVDGLIFELNDVKHSESLGATSHHENCRLALKWKDESEDTVIRNIQWQIGRTGVLTPVAIFDPIELDGTTVDRALVHNITYIKDMKLGVEERVAVAKQNLIIPQIVENHSNSGNCPIPSICPECGCPTVIKKLEDTEVLYCTNSNCKGKLIKKFTWFVGKTGMNIDALSEATLTKLIENNIIKTYADLYTLHSKKNEVVGKLDKFGERSWERLINNIEKSRHCKLENFITALGIDNIGKSTAKTISKYCNGSWNEFMSLIDNIFDFSTLEDIGAATSDGIYKWFTSPIPNRRIAANCASYLTFEVALLNPTTTNDNAPSNVFSGQTIVVTGTLQNFTRESIQEKIEALGGHCSSSVSKKTNFVLAGDKAGSKLKKALELGVKVLNENEFIEMIGE